MATSYHPNHNKHLLKQIRISLEPTSCVQRDLISAR